MIKDSFIWTDKYRPANLDTFIGSDSYKSKIKKMIDEGDIPHLLLFGSAGSGKTTTAKIIVRNIDCDYLYINASDENSIDVMRTKIKSFASTIGFKDIKIIILDEADHMSPSAMAALRNIMETFSKTTRFILTANYIERIIDPIISRTQQFKLEPPSKADVGKHIVKILNQENIQYDLSPIKLLIDAHFPDIRKIINECQSNSSTGTLVIDSSDIIDSDAKLSMIEILSGDSKDKLNKIRQLIADNDVRDFAEFYDLLYSKITQYAGDNISQIILHIADGVRWDGQVVNKSINFIACVTNIIQTIN